jgi:hypothetical protein
MGKKNRITKLFESTSIESVEAHPHSAASTPADQQEEEKPAPANAEEAHADETSLPEEATTGRTDSLSEDLQGEEGAPVPGPAEETPSDDVLDDVRRSLIEEEINENQKDSRWWRRFGRKGKKTEPEVAPVPVEIDLPATFEPVSDVETPAQKEETQEELDQIEDLIQMLEAEKEAAVEPPVAPPMETAPEPEPAIDFEALKKQAFQSRPSDEEAQDISQVRSIAMEGGEDVLVEVEAKPVDPMEERLQSFENALKPYRRYIYTALALLGVGMAVVASLILFNIYQQSRPQPVKEPSDLPYPTAVSLPGGWSFQLGRGTLQNGRWDPRGAEWLEGTEVCRWVALPWSTQLEAVLRTLNPRDPIELVMSNNDKLIYEVYSIRQLTVDEMEQLDSNSPCLLVILTQTESEKRWVLTALP